MQQDVEPLFTVPLRRLARDRGIGGLRHGVMKKADRVRTCHHVRVRTCHLCGHRGSRGLSDIVDKNEWRGGTVIRILPCVAKGFTSMPSWRSSPLSRDISFEVPNRPLAYLPKGALTNLEPSEASIMAARAYRL